MKKRVNAHIYVTPLCNLKCKHCYSSENQDVEKNVLSIDQLVDVTKQLVARYDTYMDVEGGELFMRKDIGEYFQKLDKEELERITVTTNGSILYDIDSSYLKALDEFRVSLEGHTDELHKALRNISLTPIMNNCSKWLAEGVPVVLRMTLNRVNYRYIPDALKKFMELGFKRFSFYEFQSVGRGNLIKDEFALSESELQEAIRLFRREVPKYHGIECVKLSLGRTREELVDRLREENAEDIEIKNLTGPASIYVNYDGDMGICPWHVNEGNQYRLKYEKHSFASDIEHLVEINDKEHDCDNCTTRRIFFFAKE